LPRGSRCKPKTLWRGRGRITPAGVGALLARFENGTTRPDYFRFSKDFTSLQRITDVEPRRSGLTIGPMESFEVTAPSFDGRIWKLQPAVFLPAGYKKGNRLPTVVYFYAGPPFSEYAQDFGGGAPNLIPVQLFATRGYAVLFVDVPLGPLGTGGNPIQEMTDAVLP
jgi:dipeptidyl aminopeptidase/acylaminoacyl peptidase